MTNIVDAWAQLPLTAGELPKEVRRLLQQSGTSHVLENGIDPDEVVAQMDAAGIETLLVSAWSRPGEFLMSNDQVADLTRRYPGRFVGVAAVDLEHPIAAVNELERAVKELGFKALRVIPWLWNRPPNDALYYPLYVKCIELDIPFCTQVGHTGPLMPSETGRPIPYLDQVALDFPELTIVGGHTGYPWIDEMVGLAWKHENVYIDTSAWIPKVYPRALVQFMKTIGGDKVLFGTNFPQLPLERCVEEVHNLELPEPLAAKFLSENARKVFKL